MRKRKWENYSSGEELFGLPVTLYPELELTEKEIQMLDRLYGLYVTVISTIKGYGDYFWVDVVEKIDEMAEQVRMCGNCCSRHFFPPLAPSWRARGAASRRASRAMSWSLTWSVCVWCGRGHVAQVNQYQAQAKKLPKALREWQAYLDCRKTIDDFLEMLPLFQVRGGSRAACPPCPTLPRTSPGHRHLQGVARVR